MAAYASLPDPVVGSKDSHYSCVCQFKFCSMGLVVSNTWTAGFIAVEDGLLKLYDSRQTYQLEPQK
jgi:hypothetical protein